MHLEMSEKSVMVPNSGARNHVSVHAIFEHALFSSWCKELGNIKCVKCWICSSKSSSDTAYIQRIFNDIFQRQDVCLSNFMTSSQYCDPQYDYNISNWDMYVIFMKNELLLMASHGNFWFLKNSTWKMTHLLQHFEPINVYQNDILGYQFTATLMTTYINSSLCMIRQKVNIAKTMFATNSVKHLE